MTEYEKKLQAQHEMRMRRKIPAEARPKTKIMYKIFSPWVRAFHWVFVITCIILFATGLYIGDPGYAALVGADPTHAVAGVLSMSFVRKIHLLSAVVLVTFLLLRIYSGIKYPGDRLLPKPWKKLYWSGLLWSIKHYLFIPQKERFWLRNPLARTAYFSIYLALFFLIVTGMAMYAQAVPNGILAKIFNPWNLWVGEYNSHLIHHILAWYCMFFMLVHVYMAFRSDYTERDGEISSMFSGYKFFDEIPADIDDLNVSDDFKIEHDATREYMNALPDEYEPYHDKLAHVTEEHAHTNEHKQLDASSKQSVKDSKGVRSSTGTHASQDPKMMQKIRARAQKQHRNDRRTKGL